MTGLRERFEHAITALGPGPVYPAFLQSLSGTSVTTTGSAPATQTGAYDCTGAFPTLNGELFLSTPSATNLSSLDTINQHLDPTSYYVETFSVNIGGVM